MDSLQDTQSLNEHDWAWSRSLKKKQLHKNILIKANMCYIIAVEISILF